MAELTYDEALELIRGWRKKIETANGATVPEVLATAFRKDPGRLAVWIRYSEEDPAIWDGVSLIAQQLLQNGKLLPNELALWVADVLAKNRPRPTQHSRDPLENVPDKLRLWLGSPRKKPRRPTRSGQHPSYNLVRDSRVVYFVEKLVEYAGFSATRNKPIAKACKEGGSACDVVGEVFGMNYKAAERLLTKPGSTVMRFMIDRAEAIVLHNQENK